MESRTIVMSSNCSNLELMQESINAGKRVAVSLEPSEIEPFEGDFQDGVCLSFELVNIDSWVTVDLTKKNALFLAQSLKVMAETL